MVDDVYTESGKVEWRELSLCSRFYLEQGFYVALFPAACSFVCFFPCKAVHDLIKCYTNVVAPFNLGNMSRLPLCPGSHFMRSTSGLRSELAALLPEPL